MGGLSAAHEPQLNLAPVVLPVGIDHNDPLPRAEHQLAALDRKRERWADEDGEQVIAPMAGRTVAVGVAVITGQQAGDELLEVLVGA